MLGGRTYAEAIRFKVGASGYGDNKENGWGGRLETWFTPDYLTTTPAISMTAGGNSGLVVNQGVATLLIPALGISESRTNTSTTYANSELILYDVERYQYWVTGGSWRLKASLLEWYVDGNLEYDESGIDLFSLMAPNQSSIPLLGTYPEFSGGTSFGDVFVIACTGSTNFPLREDAANGSATGGWEVKVDGVWYSLPLSLSPHTDMDLTGSISGTTTGAVSIDSYCYHKRLGGHIIESSGEAWSLLVPNPPRGVIRINDDYESLILRLGFPKCERVDSEFIADHNCSSGDDDTYGSETLSEYYALDNPVRSGITNTYHSTESQIVRDIYAPARVSGRALEGFPTITRDTQQTSGFSIDLDRSTIPAYFDNFDTVGDSWRAVYANVPGSPHWLYGLWFPPDGLPDAERWNLQGGPSPISYWWSIRQQWMNHPDLPSGENTQRRINHVSSPIAQNGLYGVAQGAIGTPCFWGISEFGVSDQSAWPTSFETNVDSESRIHFKDGTGDGTGSVDGSGITLDTGDAIEIDVLAFDSHPYGGFCRCDRIIAALSSVPNLDTFKILAVGIDESQVEITDNTDGTFPIPAGPSEQWVTDSATDHGASELVDTYDPIAPDDESTTAVIDSARSLFSQLLPARTPYRIRIEITRINPVDPVAIPHIELLCAPLADARVLDESGSVSVILFKNGPAIQFGRVGFWDIFTDDLLDIPSPISVESGRMTMGDMWCMENLFFKGVAALTDIYPRLQDEFIENEEFTVAKHAWRYIDESDNVYIDTVGFLAQGESGPQLCYYNTLRQAPPSGYFPTKKRSFASDWKPTGDLGTFTYEIARNKHPSIAPGSTRPQLLDSLDNDILSTASVPSGWAAGVHSMAVTNDEGYDYRLRWNGTDWYKKRTWRGNFDVFGLAVETGKALDYAISRSQKHAWALEKEGRLIVRINDNNFTLWHPFDLDEAQDVVKICWDTSSTLDRLWVLTIKDGTLSLRHTDGDYGTLSAVVATFEADMADIASTRNGIRYVYSIESGNLIGRGYDNQNDLVIGPLTTNITGIDSDSPLGMDTSVFEGKTRITVTYNIGGSAVVVSSTDLINFS